MTSLRELSDRVREAHAAERAGLWQVRTPEDIPGSPEQLNREWLTAVLCAAVPGAEVTGFSLGPKLHPPRHSGRSLMVNYNDTGATAGLPTRIFTKSLPNLTSRLEIGASGSSEIEAHFYREVRPQVTIETPAAYYSAYDPESMRVFILLEDVISTKGARLGTAVDTYVDRPAAEAMVTLLATLHGTFWGRSAGLGVASFSDVQRMQNDAWDFERRSLIGFERSRDLIPADIFERRQEWHGALMRSIGLGPDVETLIHRDTHLGNWYFTETGKPGILDWQNASSGNWGLDLVYALSIALSIDDRRAWESELLEIYLARLEQVAGQAPSFDEAWLNYRRQVFHAAAAWIVTEGWGENRPVAEDIVRINIRRTTQAASDLRCFEAVDEH